MAYIGKQEIFINNKYKLWHDKIIAKAKNRTLEGYKEVHHIIPKSCGGSNDKDNLIALTAREHYIIHMLLPFCVTKEYKFKMIKGFLYMNVKTKSHKRFYKINSRMYQKFRLEYGIMHKGFKHTEEVKKLISIQSKARKHSQETKEKIGNYWKGKKRKPFSEEHRKKISIQRQKQIMKPVSEETKKTISLKNTGKKRTPEQIKKISEATKLALSKLKGL